jgi:hypothetical protein
MLRYKHTDQAKSTNMLEQEIQRAIDNYRRCDFFLEGEGYRGYPIKMDLRFVKIVCINTKAQPHNSAVWILRLDRIESFSPISEEWDLDRLYRILEQENSSITQPEDSNIDDEPPNTLVLK